MLPTRSSSIAPVCAGAIPLAVLRITGLRPVPVSTEASLAVSAEIAVTVAPLSISIRRGTPLTLALTQKCPSADIRTRSSLPTTRWSSMPRLSVIRASVGW